MITASEVSKKPGAVHEEESPLVRQQDRALPSPADAEVLSQLVERCTESRRRREAPGAEHRVATLLHGAVACSMKLFKYWSVRCKTFRPRIDRIACG